MSIGKLAGDARTYRDRSSNRTAWVDRPHVAEIAHICEFRDGAADAEKQQIRQPAPRPIPIGFPLANSRCPLGMIRRQSFVRERSAFGLLLGIPLTRRPTVYFLHESTCMGDAEAHGVGSAGTDDTARTGRAGVCGDNGGAAGEIFCAESGGVDARGSAEAVGEDCQGSAD